MKAVLDANVFMRGKGIDYGDCYTVPAVEEELESDTSSLRFDTINIKVQQPSRETVEKVSEKSGEIKAETSREDEQLLALALDLEAVVVSDDKGVQNLASHLGVKFESYMGEEIEEERKWRRVCGNCGAQVPGNRCERCGSTRVERKPG